MFIYIQIINPFYSYVLFYANTIKASSEHNLLYYACLWRKLQHGKTMMLMLSASVIANDSDLNTVKSIWHHARSDHSQLALQHKNKITDN